MALGREVVFIAKALAAMQTETGKGHNGITIKGSIVGNRADLAEVFELHAAGRTKVERHTRKLEDVNEAFEEVESGRAKARLVFDFR
jgi:D-arabinose 1-dehydrogenase-like Zn-dependent alcohol dehydrogenase